MSLEQDIRNLSRIPIFAEVEPEALRLLAFAAETRILRTGEILFRKGDMSDGGYVILSGTMRLESGDDRGVGPLARTHALVGELALVTQTERPVSAIAHEPTTVLKISRQLFQRVLKEFPQSAVRLRATLEERLIAFTRGMAQGQSFTDITAPRA